MFLLRIGYDRLSACAIGDGLLSEHLGDAHAICLPALGRPVYPQQHLACPERGFGSPAVPRHGAAVRLADRARKFIVKVREEDPAAYLRVCATLVPKELELMHDGTDPFLQMLDAISSGRFDASLGEAG